MIINGISILTFVAAQLEYGSKMQKQGIDPEFIGVGPIEAAFNTTKILMKMRNSNKLPDVIFCIGTAGSGCLKQGELYQINKVSYRDMDASAFGFPKGKTPYTTYPSIFELPVLFKDIPTASLATGASVVDKQGSSQTSFDTIDADAVDMETYAIVRVAHDFNIPIICLRGISDGTEESVGIETWEEYLEIIDEKFAKFYERLHKENTQLITIIAQIKSGII